MSHRFRQFLTLFATFGLLGCTVGETPLASEPEATEAANARDIVPGRYIIEFEPGTDAAAVAAEYGLPAPRVFRTALSGFSTQAERGELDGLRADPRVRHIERVRVYRTMSGTMNDPAFEPAFEQANATWGLDRIDQPHRPLDGFFTYDLTGDGVTIYIVDSGIYFDHQDFGGRAVLGHDGIGDGREGDDCHGHGTHVAGTAAGTRWGVAKGADLVAVRVFGCTGSTTTDIIVDALDWVAENAQLPAVVNMSLGGPGSTILDNATQRVMDAGITVAVAAGNGDRFTGVHQPACNYSPARVPGAITVGATDSTDVKASFSNYGDCVDLFAPGVAITSAYINAPDGAATANGTSMASPHAAGVAALYLEENPDATPAEVSDALQLFSVKGMIARSLTSNNMLLYSYWVPDADRAAWANGNGQGR